jgi:hypothetical protein
MEMIGKGVSGNTTYMIEWTQAMVDASGGLENFQKNVGLYFEKFFSPAEKSAAQLQFVNAGLAKFNTQLPSTRDGLRAMVQGIDTTTESGQKFFAYIMSMINTIDGIYSQSEEIAKSRADMEIRIMELTGRASEALAARRKLELEQIDASLRALQIYIWELEDTAEAANEAAEAAAAEAAVARDIATNEIELMRLQGRVTESLNRQRAMEVDGVNEIVAALKMLIFAEQDLRRIQNLSIELSRLQGDAQTVVNQTRELELKDLTESERVWKRQIYAEEDLAKARSQAITLLEAEGETYAALQLKRAEDLRSLTNAERARQLVIWQTEDALKLGNTMRDLDIQLLRAQGQEEKAIALERANAIDLIRKEYGPMADMIIARQQEIWALETAARAEDLLISRRELEIQLLEALGETESALAAKRLIELNAMDESLKKTQLQIWAIQDLTVSIDKFKARAEQISQFIDELTRGDLAPVQSAESWDAKYNKLRSEAMGANATDKQISDYLAYAKEYLTFQKSYGTEGSYQAIYDAIMADAKSLETANANALTIAEQQLDAIRSLVQATIDMGNQQVILLQKLIAAATGNLKHGDGGGFASGGIATGPNSGYGATLHGTELVISPRTNYPATIKGKDNVIQIEEIRKLRESIDRLTEQGGDINVNIPVNMDGREIGNVIARQVPRNDDLRKSIKAVR